MKCKEIRFVIITEYRCFFRYPHNILKQTIEKVNRYNEKICFNSEIYLVWNDIDIFCEKCKKQRVNGEFFIRLPEKQ